MERTFYRSQHKLQWVKHEVMKLKVLMPQTGCRTIADTFNRMFFREDMSVRFWYNHVRMHQHVGGKTPDEIWSDRGDYPRFTDGAKRSPLTCHHEGRSSEAISAVRGRLRIGIAPPMPLV